MKIRNVFVILFLVLLIAIFAYQIVKTNNKTNTGFAAITITGKAIQAEIADTAAKRAKGLMFRQELAEEQGMLFVFEQEQEVSFWMKNTLIPLDLIFLDKDLKIVDIKQDFQPCKTDSCLVYSSKQPAKYVLEVNSGFIKANDIKIGDVIQADTLF